MSNEYFHTDDPEVLLLEIRNTKNEGDILVSASDYKLLFKHSWSIKDSMNANPKGYVSAKINGKHVKMHRYLLKVTDRSIIVDHHNRDTWDNTRTNLRKTTYSQNNLNITLSKNNSTGKTGLMYMKPSGTRSARWYALVRVNGKRYAKYFAVAKFGEEIAKKLANEALKQHNILSE